MKFKIDRRYIAIQLLLAIGGYILGVLIVLKYLDLKAPMDFVGTSLFAGIILYFAFFFPRSILIKDRTLSFVEKNGLERTKVNLADITQIDSSCKPYNTLVIITKSDKTYKLHPKDVQGLEKVIRSYQ